MGPSFRIFTLICALVAAGRPFVASADAPELIGHTAGVSYAVAVDGELAAIGAGRRAVLIDLSDMSNPRAVGRTEFMPRTVRSLHLRDGRLIVGLESKDVYVFDVTDPAKPARQAILNSDGEVRDLYAAEDLVFLASFGEGVIVVDMEDPTRPRELSRERTARDINDVIVAEEILFASSATAGLHVFSIGQRGRLELLSTVRSVVGNGKANQMAIEGSTVYVANGITVVAVDVSNPERPELLGAFGTTGGSRDIAVRGDRVFVADGIEGVLVVDASDPLLPQPLGALRLPFDAIRLAVQDDVLYAIDWVTGLHTIDVSGEPTAIASFSNLGFARSVSRMGDAVFVGLSRNAVASYESESLTFLDKQPLPANAQELSVRAADGKVFVGDVRAGLWAYSAEQPDALALLDHMPMHVRDIEIAGPNVYVTTGLGGFQTASAADPTALVGLQKIDSIHFSWGLSLVGSLAYIADREGGIQIVDVSRPAILNEVARITGLGRTRDVEVRGNLAYVADADNGLLIFDVSVPSQARQIGAIQSPWGESGTSEDPFLHPQRIALSSGGRYAIVANTEPHISIYDISRPDLPRLDHTLKLSWPTNDFAVYEDLLYVAAGGEGLLLYRLDDGVGEGGGGTSGFTPSNRRDGLSGIGMMPLIASLLMLAAAVAGVVLLRRQGTTGGNQAEIALPAAASESEPAQTES